MNTTSQQTNRPHHGRILSLTAGLAICILSLSGITTAHAQSSTGSVFGFGPAGSTVTAHGDMGAHRKTVINKKGRYELRRLRLGTYAVTLKRDGKVVDKRLHIPVTVAGGAQVNFFCPNDQCAAITSKATTSH